MGASAPCQPADRQPADGTDRDQARAAQRLALGIRGNPAQGVPNGRLRRLLSKDGSESSHVLSIPSRVGPNHGTEAKTLVETILVPTTV